MENEVRYAKIDSKGLSVCTQCRVRNTQHSTGRCTECRTVVCKKCQKWMLQRVNGQTICGACVKKSHSRAVGAPLC